MASINEYIFLFFISFFLIGGCTLSSEDDFSQESTLSSSSLETTEDTTEEFIANVNELSVNITVSYNRLSDEFLLYDLKYNPLVFWFPTILPSNYLTEMEILQEQITADITRIRQLLARYEILKEHAQLDNLNEQETEQYHTIEEIKTSFTSLNSIADGCLLSSSKYYEYVSLFAEEDLLHETRDVQESLIDQYFFAEEYSKAKEALNDLEDTLAQIIKLKKTRRSLSIDNMTDDYISSWEEYARAYISYGAYIAEMEQWGYTDDAIAHEQESSKRFASSFEEDLRYKDSDGLNSVTDWYNENIRICVSKESVLYT